MKTPRGFWFSSTEQSVCCSVTSYFFNLNGSYILAKVWECTEYGPCCHSKVSSHLEDCPFQGAWCNCSVLLILYFKQLLLVACEGQIQLRCLHFNNQ